MKLKGKILKDFNKFYTRDVTERYDNASLNYFYSLPFCKQIGVYVDFFIERNK